jgi:hypothetical protein
LGVGAVWYEPLLEDMVCCKGNRVFVSEEDDLPVKGSLGADYNQIETIITKFRGILFDDILTLILINNRIGLDIHL